MAKRLQNHISQMSDKTRLLHWLGKIGSNPHCPFCGRLDPGRVDYEKYVLFICDDENCHAVSRYSKDKVKKVTGE